jgi:Type IV pilus assembly protein PilM
VKEKRIGLYLGVNSIGAAVTQGKNLVALKTFEFSALEDQGSEIANEDIRWEALLNKAIREVGPDAKTVYISLADKDFIFRALEMPLMNRKEVESSIQYEVEKYIPFKMEELEWDFEFVKFAQQRKINLSFMGIRENNLQRVRDIFSRLAIEVSVMEPACLSVARAVKSNKRFSKLKDFAILDLTNAESYLTFFQHDLPVFNRYLVTPLKDGAFDAVRFNESVDLSFQYFKREFKSYKLERCIIVGDIADANSAGALKESLGTEVEAVSAYDITARNNATVESLKAFGVCTRGLYKTACEPVFKKVAAEAPVGEKQAIGLPALKVWLHGTLLGAGLLSCLFLSVFMGQEVTVKKVSIKKNEAAIQVPAELQPYSWKERAAYVSERDQENKSLNNMASSFKGLSSFFEAFSTRGVVSEGAWFSKFMFTTSATINPRTRLKTFKINCFLEGYVYLDNPDAESEVLDDLLFSLKKEKRIRDHFSNVELTKSQRKDKDGYNLLSFNIKLEE